MSARIAGLASLGLFAWITSARAQPTPVSPPPPVARATAGTPRRPTGPPAPRPAVGQPAQRPAAAPPAPRQASRLTAKDRETAVKRIQAEVQAGYVFPELRGKIVERLDRAAKAGRYDVEDPASFAERVTEDLRDESHDHHMSLGFDPTGYAAALAPPRSDAGEAALERRQASREHHGLVELKRLPGNVRYLRITQFHWIDDETGAVYDDAIRFLREGDAIIIDLRGNPGGSHGAVRYLVSHFLDPNILELTFLEGSETSQSRTLEHLPAGRLKGKPLYVLIDRFVGSAAEAFAYDVQQFKLGELVGATTTGAANNNRFSPVAPSFLLSLSFGRPVHAVSHANWEGVGIKPTVPAEPAQALDVAQSLALARLAQARGAADDAVADYAWARLAVEARLHPPVIAPAQLALRVGRYGELAISQRDGALYLVRASRADARLIPLSADVFAVEGSDLLRVRLSAKALDLLWPGLAPRHFPRS